VYLAYEVLFALLKFRLLIKSW